MGDIRSYALEDDADDAIAVAALAIRDEVFEHEPHPHPQSSKTTR